MGDPQKKAVNGKIRVRVQTFTLADSHTLDGQAVGFSRRLILRSVFLVDLEEPEPSSVHCVKAEASINWQSG